MRLDSISHATITEVVADRIRQALIEGRFRPGERLVEAELARQLQVSRAPLREALRQLEREGLLESLPRRGHRVIRLREQDVWEVHSLRVALEGLAVRRVVETWNPQFEQRLLQLVERMAAAVAAGDAAAALQADMDFHETICVLSGHGRLVNMFRYLRSQIHLMIRVWGYWSRRPEELVNQHRALVAAFASRDPDRAVRLLEAHALETAEALAEISRSSSSPE